MRRLGLFAFLVILFILLVLGPAGCGSSSGPVTGGTPGAPASVAITPAPISMTPGQTLQATANVYDASGNQLSGQPITWTSNDTTRLDVSPTGLLCAGTWNAVFTVCTAGPTGSPILTAATSSSISSSVTVVVHGPVVGGVALVSISPTQLSLNRGDVVQVTATAFDAQNNPVSSQTIAFTSSNTTVLTTSPSGLLCAGTWDTSFIHCTPGPVGTSNLTATASPSNVTSTAVTVYVHDKANSIVVGELSPVPAVLTCGVPPAPATTCVSVGATAPNNTAKYTAIACSNDPAVCGGVAPVLCQLPANTLGAFTFGTTNTTVATAAPDTANPMTVAVVTAKGSGQTLVTATLSGTTSLPAQFITCPAASIDIHVSGQPTTTTFSIAKAATTTLVADVVDTLGNSMGSSVTLLWVSSQLAAANVTAAGLVTGVAPGTANIVAACVPPSCNAGTTQALYSNVATATVTGTVNPTTVYVTSSDAGTTTLIPINTSDNSVGTAINLPGGFGPPNSFLFAPSGATAFLGSDSGLIIFNPATTTFTTQPSVKGKVLAVSKGGTRVLVADTTGPSNVYLYNSGTLVATTYNIAGATAADFTPDGNYVFVTATGVSGTCLSGNCVYEIATGVFNTDAVGGAPTDVALLASGAFAYVADPGTDMFSTCTNASAGAATADTPILIRAAAKPLAAPNQKNLQMISVVGATIEQIDVVPGAPGNPCPAAPSNTANPYSFLGVAAFTPVQLQVTPDSSRAIITASDVPKLLVYQLGNPGTPDTISLAGAATGSYTAAVTMDSATVYAGVAGANEVQAFTLSSKALVKQISVPLSPKLVAIRNQ